MPCDLEQTRAEKWNRISEILDSIPTIADMVLRDPSHGIRNHRCGSQGMTDEQVLRAAVIKQIEVSAMES